MELDNLDLYENAYLKLKFLRRRNIVNPIYEKRRKYGEFHHLHNELKQDENKFFAYYRMTIQTFYYILRKIQTNIRKKRNDAITPEEKLSVTIRFLATGNSFRSLSFSFRISHSSLSIIVREVCTEIWNNLVPIHMAQPTENDHKKTAEQFLEKWKYPNCFGSIDGKHIRIKKPNKSGSVFFNYKHYFSIVLQGVSDANYRFVCIEVGAFGKQSDGGMYESSNLCSLIERDNFNIPQPMLLPLTSIKAPFVMLGDEAYPLKSYLMRPYAKKSLNKNNVLYNERHCKARQTIECAFGLLTSKWRILGKAIETNVTTAKLITKCVCLLHNIVIDKEGIDRVALLQLNSSISSSNNSDRRSQGTRADFTATNVRDLFTAFFCNEVSTV